jgi:hypothetical protein
VGGWLVVVERYSRVQGVKQLGCYVAKYSALPTPEGFFGSSSPCVGLSALRPPQSHSASHRPIGRRAKRDGKVLEKLRRRDNIPTATAVPSLEV